MKCISCSYNKLLKTTTHELKMVFTKNIAQTMAATISLLSGIFIIGMLATGIVNYGQVENTTDKIRAAVVTASMNSYDKNNASLTKAIENVEYIQSSMDEILKRAGGSESIQLADLSAKVAMLDKQIGAINDAIMSSPEKSLAIPMMRKDIDSTNKTLQTVYESMDHQLERAYTLFMWICGTLGVGMVAISISIFTSFKSANKS